MLYYLFDLSSYFYSSVLIICLLCLIALFSAIPSKKQRTNHLENFAVSFFCKHKIACSMLFVFIISICAFGNASFIHLMGDNDIRTMYKGMYCYYVIAENEKGLKYILPAQVEKFIWEEYKEQSEKTIKYTYERYIVSDLYFPNGESLYINEMDYAIYGEKTKAIDQNENTWYIIITNRKAENDKAYESSLIRIDDIVFGTIKILIFLSTWMLCFHYSRKEEQNTYRVNENIAK